MSMLSQDTHRRLVQAIADPPGKWKEVAAAWDRGEVVCWRYAGLSGSEENDPENPWKLIENWKGRSLGSRHGIVVSHTPNWHNDEMEFRVFNSLKQEST